MATVRCRCGGMFSDGSIPCEEQYHLLPDVALEGVVDRVITFAREAKDEAEVFYAVRSAATLVYKCPDCGRLIVFWDGLSHVPRFYKPEESPHQ